ncbi:MAG: hypothetical protein ABFS46_11820 [Myxococcota bacterium]
MRRWLLVGLGLATGLAALLALATSRPSSGPHDSIDDDSRGRLERVLRESDPPRRIRP